MKSIEHDIENDTQAAKSNTRSFQTNNCIHGKDDGGIEHRIDHHAESAFASLAFGFGMSMAPSSPMLPSLVIPPGCLQPGCPIASSKPLLQGKLLSLWLSLYWIFLGICKILQWFLLVFMDFHIYIHIYLSKYIYILYTYHISILVGGIPTTLKNMSSSVGMIIPNMLKKNVPNHQPVSIYLYTYHI